MLMPFIPVPFISPYFSPFDIERIAIYYILQAAYTRMARDSS
jgi:hypothetical protein